MIPVEEPGDPPCGEQRLPPDVEGNVVGHVVAVDHVEDGEREPVELPRIGLLAPRRLQEREERAGVRDLDVRDDAVSRSATAGPEAPRQLVQEPRLRTRVGNHDPRPREQIGVAAQEPARRFEDILESAHVGNVEAHGDAGYHERTEADGCIPPAYASRPAALRRQRLRSATGRRPGAIWQFYRMAHTPFKGVWYDLGFPA